MTYSPHGTTTVTHVCRLGQHPQCGTLRILLSSASRLSRLKLRLPSPLGHLSTTFLPKTFSPVTITHPSYALRALTSATRNEPNARNVHVPGSTLYLRVLHTANPLTTSDTGHSNSRDTRAISRTIRTFKGRVSLCLSNKPARNRVSDAIIGTSPCTESNVRVLHRKIVPRSVVHGTLRLGNKKLNT